jgi:hypothetical protein
VGAGAFEFLSAYPKRVDGSVHGCVGEASGLRYPFAEPDDARERIDDPEAAARRAREQETTIIRAEIERAVNRAARLCLDGKTAGVIYPGRPRLVATLGYSCLLRLIGETIHVLNPQNLVQTAFDRDPARGLLIRLQLAAA